MTKIKFFTRAGIMNSEYQYIETDMSVGEWAVNTFKSGHVFSIFDGKPSVETDITFDVDKCFNGYGEYTVIETPSSGLEVPTIVMIITAVVSVAAIVMMPKVPDVPNNANRNQNSPNNELSSRSNRARPLQRIPDIKGTVLSIPDTLMQTYTRYQNLQTKVEYGYYCVGRKKITLTQIKDGGSLISLINGASAQIYYPFRSPNDGDPADVQIGDVIDRDVSTIQRLSEVNGIDLAPIIDTGGTPIVFDSLTTTNFQMSVATSSDPSVISISINEKLNFSDWLSKDYYEGNRVIFNNIKIYDQTPPYNIYTLNATLLITSEVTRTVTSGANNYSFDVQNDGSVPTGVVLGTVTSGSITTEFFSPFNEWYYCDQLEFNKGFINVSAPQGMYLDTGEESLVALKVEYQLEVEPIDEVGTPSGISQVYTGSISGNSSVTRGQTVDFDLPYPTRFRIRVKRTTPKFQYEGTVVDNIILSDIYGEQTVSETEFGDITTIFTRTIYNESASSVKERQLNCIAREMVYKCLPGGSFESGLTVNNSAIQSYITDWIDPKLGGQDINDLDVDGLLALETEISDYFGDELMHQFNYTIDDTKITFMEYTQLLFNAINCIAYREGSLLKAKFEKEEFVPVTVFTHRSKMPDSETYTRVMNQSRLNDGVELVWVDPNTNTNETLYLPSDKSAVNPKKVEIAGIRNYRQALVRLNREYNKIIYGKLVLTMSVTGDARFLVPGDIVSVVKGTRMNTFDGDILNVSDDGYTLTLSNDVSFDGSGPWSIILKHEDGIESIGCTAGSVDNEIVLDQLPTNTIHDDSIEYGRRTEFSFGSDELLEGQLYMVRDISVEDHHSISLSLVNYDSRFYQYDTQTINAFSDGFDSGFS